jgi:hypothetical protein
MKTIRRYEKKKKREGERGRKLRKRNRKVTFHGPTSRAVQ